MTLPSGQEQTWQVYKNGSGAVTYGPVLNYDENGRLVSYDYITSWSVSTTTYDYDEDGHLVREVSPGDTISYEYYPDGTRKKVTTQGWDTLVQEYNEQGQLAMVTRMNQDGSFAYLDVYDYDDGFYTITEKNEDGDIVSVSKVWIDEKGLGHTLTSQFDGEGNLVRTTESIYDHANEYGRYIVRNPEGEITMGMYETTDEDGNTVYVYINEPTCEGSKRCEFAYNANNDQVYSRYYNAAGELRYSHESVYDEYGNKVEYWENGALYAQYFYDNPNWKADAKRRAWLANRKLIYTIDEAEKVSKPTGNTFRIRYR